MISTQFTVELARAIVIALGAGILASALLAGAVFGVTRIPPRPSATTRHFCWWLALIACVALPLGSVAVSLSRIEHRFVVASSSAAQSAPAAALP